MAPYTVSGYSIFERFNGILGQLPNNNHSMEVQLMNRFVRYTSMRNLINFFSSWPQSVGTVSDSMSILTPPPILLIHERITNHLIDWTTESSEVYIALPSHCAKAIFNASQVEDLRTVYSIMYSTPPSSIQVNSAFWNTRQLQSIENVWVVIKVDILFHLLF